MNPETAPAHQDADRLLDELAALDAELAASFDGRIATEPFLSRKTVSFQGNKGKSAYGWYKYKEAFSADLVEYLLNRYGEPVVGRILDPFAGVGTALFAASALGNPADGVELLPVGQQIIHSRFLAERKLTDGDIADLERWANERPWVDCPNRLPFSVIRITENAYPPETADAIERYRSAVQQENKQVQAILRMALLCVLESVSYTRKDGQYLRWDARSGRRRPGTKPFHKGPIAAFDDAAADKINELVTDIRRVKIPASLFPAKQAEQGGIRLFKGSCLNILPTLEANAYSAVVTSPPYCNRYDYTRTYALELTMLGLTQAEVSELRQKMLSCTVENREKDLLKICPNWSPFIEAANRQKLLGAVNAYLERERKAKRLNNNGIPRMVRGYFLETACVIGECARVLKPGAPLFMVNDNVRYAGVSVSVDLILSDIARSLGFEVESILVAPAKKGNSSQQMGAYGRAPLRKCICVWRKKLSTVDKETVSHELKNPDSVRYGHRLRH